MEEESRQEHNEIIKEAAKSQIAALKREMDWLKSQMEVWFTVFLKNLSRIFQKDNNSK